MDVGSKVPAKLATRQALDGLDSLRLVALSSGIGLEVDSRTPKVLVMDFSEVSMQGKIQHKTSLNPRELVGGSERFRKIPEGSTPSTAFNSNKAVNLAKSSNTNLYNPDLSQSSKPVSSFARLVEENKKANEKIKNKWLSFRAKKAQKPSLDNNNSSSNNIKNTFRNESQVLSERKSFGARIFTRFKQVIAHSIDICIVFNFSLIVIAILSMIIWGIYPSDIISSPIVGYILQMRWIEFMFWIYVGFFVYRYLLRHLIGSTLGSRLCFGRRTKSEAQKS